MTSTETDWRAEPNPDLDQIDNWRVCYEIAGIRYDIAIELEEQDARLIAAAHEMADALLAFRNGVDGQRPVTNVDELFAALVQVSVKVNAALKAAGRAPQ